MAHKVDYAELRRIYFNYQPDREPSHSNGEDYLDDSNLALHNLMTMMSESQISDYEEMLEDNNLTEIDRFKSKLSKPTNEIINNLYDKYGAQIYTKMIQLIKDKEITEWNQLEKELLSGNFEFLVEDTEAPIFNELEAQSLSFDGSFDESIDHSDEDMDYLDALVQQDYRRLKSLPSDKGAISSIFSEILENEQQNNSNYQDDIFEKNIELIFNSNIDLDSTEWQDDDAYIDLLKLDSIQPLGEKESNEMNHAETLQNLEETIPSELFQKIDKVDNSEAPIKQEAANQEKVIVRKVVVKKTAKDGFNFGFIALMLLISILAVSVIMLALMVLR